MNKLACKVDHGTLRFSNHEFADYSLEACGLSLGWDHRSVFEECTFTRIKAKKCSVGIPIFKRCRFVDISADDNGVFLYGAGFSECVFSGVLRNVVFDFMCDQIPMQPDKKRRAEQVQKENLELAARSAFTIDLRSAAIDKVAICKGDLAVPYVRCERGQAVILKADNLFEKLVELGRAESNQAKGDFFLTTGALPGDRVAIALVENAARKFIEDCEQQMRRKGIEVDYLS